MSFTFTFLLVLLSLHVLSSAPNPSEISCEAGKFYIGNPGSVACHFNKDIRQHRHNFNVVFYPSNKNHSSSDSGIYVLLCNWGTDTRMECKVESGYQFDYNVNDSLTVHIPNVTENVAGLYICQLVPDEGNPVNTCTLTAEHPPLCTATPAFCNACSDASATAENGTATVPLGVFIIAVVILIIAVVLLIMYIVFRSCICKTWIRPRRRFVSNENEDKEKAEEEMLMDRIAYPANTANKQTHTFIDTIEKGLQVGVNNVVVIDHKSTQVNEDDKVFLTGNLKAAKTDVVMTGSAERFRNPTYYTLGTPPVVVPKHIIKKKLKTNQNESAEQ